VGGAEAEMGTVKAVRATSVAGSLEEVVTVVVGEVMARAALEAATLVVAMQAMATPAVARRVEVATEVAVVGLVMKAVGSKVVPMAVPVAVAHTERSLPQTAGCAPCRYRCPCSSP
jgi:hypothetical protein